MKQFQNNKTRKNIKIKMKKSQKKRTEKKNPEDT